MRTLDRAARTRSTRQGERLRSGSATAARARRAALDHTGARLQALSPLATLEPRLRDRAHGPNALRAAADVAAGDRVDIELAAGSLGARVERPAVSEERSFEELQRELEEIVTRLERGDVPVDEAIALLRRGEELYRDVRRAASGRRAPDRGARTDRPRRVTRGTVVRV